MKTNPFNERTISAQWGGFLERSLVFIDRSRGVYEQNKNTAERYGDGRRKLIAPAENRWASIGVIILAVSLEDFCNCQAFMQKLEPPSYDGWWPLDKKVRKVSNEFSQNFVNAVLEFSICRDILVHGHLWVRERRYGGDYSIRYIKSQASKVLKNQFSKKRNKKYAENVDIKRRLTKRFHFPVIPTDVSYLDCLKGLRILGRVLDTTDFARIMSFYANVDFTSNTRKEMKNRNLKLRDWVIYFADQLHQIDRRMYDSLSNSI